MGSTEYLMSSLGEAEVAERVNAFFPEVLDRIGLTAMQMRKPCEVRVRELPIHGSHEGQPLHLSDDRITELWVQERTVAAIIELRTSFNFAQILFADYLSPQLIADIRQSTQNDLLRDGSPD